MGKFLGGVSEPVKTVSDPFFGDKTAKWDPPLDEYSFISILSFRCDRVVGDIPKGLLLPLWTLDLPGLDRGLFPPVTRELKDFLRRDSETL